MGRKSAPDPADGSDYCTGCLHSALFDHGSVCAEQRWRFLECEELDASIFLLQSVLIPFQIYFMDIIPV